MATINTLPDQELFDMAKAAGCSIPEGIISIQINSTQDEVPTIAFHCVLSKELVKVYAAWVLSKRMQE